MKPQKSKEKIHNMKKEYIQAINNQIANQNQNELIHQFSSEVEKNTMLNQAYQDSTQHNSEIMEIMRQQLQNCSKEILEKEEERLLNQEEKDQLIKKLKEKDAEVENLKEKIQKMQEERENQLSKAQQQGKQQKEEKTKNLSEEVPEKTILNNQNGEEAIQHLNEVEELEKMLEAYEQQFSMMRFKIFLHADECQKIMMGMKYKEKHEEQMGLDSISENEDEQSEELKKTEKYLDEENNKEEDKEDGTVMTKIIRRLNELKVDSLEEKVKRIKENFLLMKDSYEDDFRLVGQKNEELLEKLYEMEEEKFRLGAVNENQKQKIQQNQNDIFQLKKSVEEVRSENMKIVQIYNVLKDSHFEKEHQLIEMQDLIEDFQCDRANKIKEICLLKEENEKLGKEKEILTEKEELLEGIRRQMEVEIDEKNNYFEKCEEVLEERRKNEEGMKEQLEQAKQKVQEAKALETRVKWMEIKHEEEMKRKEDLLEQLRDENRNLKKNNQDLKYMNNLLKKDAFNVQTIKQNKLQDFLSTQSLNLANQSMTRESKENLPFTPYKKLNNSSFHQKSVPLKKEELSFRGEKKSHFQTPITDKVRSKYSFF